MRVVVDGPEKRVGSWEGNEIVDLNRACARLLHEKQGESRPYELANALIQSGYGSP